MTSADSPYLTSQGAIEYLRLDELAAPLSALYRLIKEHGLPHGRRGGLYLFDKRDLDAWVKGFGSALEMARENRQSRRQPMAGGSASKRLERPPRRA